MLGISNRPQSLKSHPPGEINHWWGDGAHMLVTPINDTEVAWAQTIPEKEHAREDWRSVDKEKEEKLLNSLPAMGWEGIPKETFMGATKVIKVSVGRCLIVIGKSNN